MERLCVDQGGVQYDLEGSVSRLQYQLRISPVFGSPQGTGPIAAATQY